MGGIAEEFVQGAIKQSPSAQIRIDPLGRVEPISTHDQVLGGRSGQIFLGCRFPADDHYRLDIQSARHGSGTDLGEKGALGRFGIDFISVRKAPLGGTWRSRSTCARAAPRTRS